MDQRGGQSKVAFDALNATLNEDTDVLEIEILPSTLCSPDQAPIVRDGKFVGISKKFLVSAYQYAVTSLFSSYEHISSVPFPSPSNVRASTIVLLVSPEHVTAANTRKRYISSLSNSSPSLRVAMIAELRFLDSILTSPLSRHTKSPTLWSHRRWLFTVYSPLMLYHMIHGRDGIDCFVVLDFELQVIQRAAEQHPRNYYAFDFLRNLVTHLLPSHAPASSENPSDTQSTSTQLAYHIVPAVRGLCYSHPSDTSAWSALLFLLQTANDELLNLNTIKETTEMVQKFRWSGEAVWTFIRTAVAGGIHLDEKFRKGLLSMLESWPKVTGQFGAGDDIEEERTTELNFGKLSERESALMFRAAGEALHWISKAPHVGK